MGDAHLLVYEPIRPSSEDDWRPLLQQQAILAFSQAVVAHGDVVLAPAHADVMTLLAANNFLLGGDLVQLYRTSHEATAALVDPLLRRVGKLKDLKSRDEIVSERKPKSCVLLTGRPSRLHVGAIGLFVYLSALSEPDFVPPPGLVLADGDEDLRGEGLTDPPILSSWDLPEGHRLALERFLAFGVAFERVLWAVGRPP